MRRRRTLQDAFGNEAGDNIAALGVYLSSIDRRLARIEEHLGIHKSENDEGPGVEPGANV